MAERKLIYQGGIPIGYFENGTAVMDSEFWGGDSARSYARQGAKLSFEPGLAQRLNAEEKEKPQPRKVRVHQMMPQVAPEKKFISYSLLCKQYGGVDPEDYEVVFDGQLETDDLGKLYEIFNAPDLPAGHTGHRLSISDVVELYDQDGSKTWYVDEVGFKPVDMK